MPTYLKLKLSNIDNSIMATVIQSPRQLTASSKSVELELLLNSVSLHFNTICHEQFQLLLKKEIDWNQLIQMASHHGILPLLNQSLKYIDSDLIPVRNLQRLQQYCRVNAIRNMGLTQELLRLLAVFEANNLQVIPYKGPTLGLMAYGDIFMRQFCDLDFLIFKEDWTQVQELLAVEKYQLRWEEAMSEAQKALYLQTSCEYTYISANQNVAIEPHWNILPKRFCIPVNFHALGKDLHSVNLLGHPTSTFTPETTLLIICLNGTKDRWQKLKLVCDVAGLIHQYPKLDWGWLLETTHRTGCTRILFLGLFLAKALFKTPLPEPIWKALQADMVVQSLASQVIETFRIPTSKLSKRSNFSRWDLSIRERWRDKIWYCWNLLVTPNEGDAALVNLPSPLYGLYSLIRPFRLVGRHGRTWADSFLDTYMTEDERGRGSYSD